MGLFGRGVNSLEKRNPDALLENEQNHLREQVASFNSELARHAGLIESLYSRDKSLTIENANFTSKIQSMIASGKTDLAQQIALKLQKNETEHASVITQLTAANQQYKELTKLRDASVRGATDKIESIAHNISDMKLQKASAEMSEMATGMITAIGSSGDTLNRLNQMVEDEKNQAAGRARVAKDSVDLNTAIELSEDTEEEGKRALAHFMTQQQRASH